MSDERVQLAEEIFAQALELPPGPRTEFINQRCASDHELTGRVRELLDVALKAGPQFMDPNEIRQLTAGAADLGHSLDEPVLPEGTILAGYTILGLLGVGGMGTVYRARQERPSRTVALKVIRRGLGSRGIMRRFEREAEVLGRLAHPGIAQIYEAGAAMVDGRNQPFIAMELVEGEWLGAYVARHSPGVEQRVRLMAGVCDAVHHAHQRGIIHRDLKPGNILVTGAGEPKILDFGVARASSASVLLTTMHTNLGQLIGTLAYMSPEQVVGNPADIDVRSDVYALGVILHELLTGKLPHDLTSRSIPEAARIIREDAPTKLSRFNRELRGELETIVAKALEKDLTRRYQSAAELGDDLRRYLAGEPIHARHDSALYVFRKQVRKHRWAFAAAMVFLVALVAFAVFATINARVQRRLASEADESRKSAIRERDNARLTSARLSDELRHSSIDRGRLEAAMGNLPTAEDLLWGQYLSDPNWNRAHWALREMHFNAPVLWTVQGLTNPTCSAISADGSRVVMADRAGTLALYDGPTGSELLRLEGIGASPSRIGFVPGLHSCVVGFAGGTAAIVALEPDSSPQAIGTGVLHKGGVSSLAVSSDARTIATGGADRMVRLWDAQTRELIRQWKAHEFGVTTMAFSPGGSLLATGSRQAAEGPIARVWNATSGQVVRELDRPLGLSMLTVSFSDDGRAVQVLCPERRLLRYELDSSGTPSELAEFGSSPVMSVSSWNGQHIMADSGGVRLFSADGRVTHSVLGHHRSVCTGIEVTGPARAVAVSANGTIRGIDLRKSPSMHVIDGFSTWCFGVHFSPDSSKMGLAVGWGAANPHGVPEIVDVRDPTKRLRVTWDKAGLRSRCVRFADNDTMLVGCGDGAVRVIDVATGQIRSKFTAAPGEIYAMDVAPKLGIVATGHTSGAIRLHKYETGELVCELPKASHRVEGLAFNADATVLACTGNSQFISLFNVSSGKIVGQLEATTDAWSVAISPGSEELAAGTYEGTVELFDLNSLSRKAVIKAHAKLVPGLSYSPHRGVLASCSEDGGVKLWDTRTLRELLTLSPKANEFVDVAFDPTGRYLGATNARQFSALFDLESMDGAIKANASYHRQRLFPIDASEP